MLYKVSELIGDRLEATDGEIGKVKEFYFDDNHWAIRYIVANTGNWLFGRTVLISPQMLAAVKQAENHVAVSLTKKQIEDSPPLQSDKPVSQQFEQSYYRYYGIPNYWGGGFTWGRYPYVIPFGLITEEVEVEHRKGDPNLRSSKHVQGYHVQALDGEIGHVVDYIVDDETWVIRYFVVDPKNWLPGQKVLVSPDWIRDVSWNEAKIIVELTKKTIELSPEFTDETRITRDYELQLHRYYGGLAGLAK